MLTIFASCINYHCSVILSCLKLMKRMWMGGRLREDLREAQDASNYNSSNNHNNNSTSNSNNFQIKLGSKVAIKMINNVPKVLLNRKSLCKPYIVTMVYNHQESLENTINTMGTRLVLHPIVPWLYVCSKLFVLKKYLVGPGKSCSILLQISQY